MKKEKSVKARNVSCQVYTILGRQTSKDYVRSKIAVFKIRRGEIYK